MPFDVAIYMQLAIGLPVWSMLATHIAPSGAPVKTEPTMLNGRVISASERLNREAVRRNSIE